MAGAMADTGLGIGGIASLLATAAPLIFGQGPKKGVSTTTGTTTPTNDPALIALLKSLVDQSTANANDPSKTADMVTDIIRKAQVAFTPTLGSAGRSGLYNSSTVQQLANESVGNATAAASQAVLTYKTQQQQLAQSGASALVNATAGKTTTGTTNETVTSAPGIPSGVSSMLGIGLAGLQAYSSRDKLLKLVGLGGPPGPGDQAAQDALINGTVPPDFVSETAAGNLPSFSSFGGGSSSSLPIFGNEGSLGGATPFTSAGDFGNVPIVGINSTAESGGLDISTLLDNLPSTVGDAVSGVTDFISGAGKGIVDAGEDVWNVLSDLFSW